MKAIQLRRNTLDIPFLDESGEAVLTLHFDRSDENIEKFRETFPKLEKKIAEAEKNDKEPSFEETRDFLKETTDSFLGDGSFDALYQLNPSLNIVSLYLYQIAIGIKEELEAEDLKAVEKKYLAE